MAFKLSAYLQRFFWGKTPEEKAKCTQDAQYRDGVAQVNQCLVASGDEGCMHYSLPASAASRLWQVVEHGCLPPSVKHGMSDRLEELGYPNKIREKRAAFFELAADPYVPCCAEFLARIENTRLKVSLAVRNKAFYQLASRADLLSMEDFIREFKYVFRVAMQDDKDYEATVQQMHYDDAWISGQKKDFNQYNVFANRVKTMDEFLRRRHEDSSL